MKPNEIKVSGEKTEIEVGEEFDLTIEVLPADAKNKNVRVVANPSGIVEIKDNNFTENTEELMDDSPDTGDATDLEFVYQLLAASAAAMAAAIF